MTIPDPADAAPEAVDPGRTGRSFSEPAPAPWHGRLWLRFEATAAGSVHQGGSTAPLRLQRGFRRAGGRLELPILHTAGGLVGGDRLSLDIALAAGSSALLTSV
ncbi:MAG: urease accessory protein UreD, partial [Cyanobium sp.]